MKNYLKTLSIVLYIVILTQLCSPFFYQRLRAFEYHRVVYKSCSGMVPYINQIDDTKPYGMNGSLASSPSACVMLAAYYGSINKKTDDLSPSGYGFYLCNTYEMKSYSFSELSDDPDGKKFSGAYGFLVKDSKVSPSPDIISDFLRAHSIMTTYYQHNGTKEELFILIKNEISKNHPVYMQLKEKSLLITGYGYSDSQKDILLVKDPTNQKINSTYLSDLEPMFFLFTRSISYDEPVKVIASEVLVQEKPTLTSKIIQTKLKGSTGIIKLHPDYSDLWINEKSNGNLLSWFYVQWDGGGKGFTSLGNGIINHFETYTKIIEDPEKNIATLTLTVHEEKLDGTLVKDALVIAIDGKGKTIKQTTNQLGYAIFRGEKGKWKFTISKKDFFEKNWTENIEQSEDKHVFILKKPKSEEELKLPNLICKEIRMSGGIAVEGKQFYINPMVQNIGKTIADSRSHVKVLLSPKNDTIISDDILLGVAEVSTLKLEEKCIATVFFYQFPAIPGSSQRDFSMWPVIIVDSDNEVKESDENNIFKANSPIVIKRKPRDRIADSPCEERPVDIPNIISPVGRADVTNPVTFTWETVECASFYFVSIYRENGGLYVCEGPICCTSYTTIFFLERGLYYWTVTPCNQWGCGPTSVKGWFFVTR